MLLATLWMSIKTSGGTLVRGGVAIRISSGGKASPRRWWNAHGHLLDIFLASIRTNLKTEPKDLERTRRRQLWNRRWLLLPFLTPSRFVLVPSNLFKISSANSHPIDIPSSASRHSRTIETSYCFHTVFAFTK